MKNYPKSRSPNLCKTIFTCVILLLLFANCGDVRPFLRKEITGEPAERPDHSKVITFFALGDWGTGKTAQKEVAASLKKEVDTISPGREVEPFVLELGDNVYPAGLPSGWEQRDEALEILEKTFGRMYEDVEYSGVALVFHVIPGNHDYAGKPGTRLPFGDIYHQETTAEMAYPNWKYYPMQSENIPDTNDSTEYALLRNADLFDLTRPEIIPLKNEQTVFVLSLDTEVLLHLYATNDTTNLDAHWQQLDRLMAQNRNATWKIMIGHHPVRSHGKHAGFRAWYWWIPPLTLVTAIDKLFYKPLQDLDNPDYQRFQNDLVEKMKQHNVDLYLSGHEHSLQLLKIRENAYQIISGSAAKRSRVTHKDDTYFSQDSNGLVRFDATREEIWIEFFAVDVSDSNYHTTARFRLTKKALQLIPSQREL